MAADAEPPWAVLAFDHREQAFASVRPAGMDRRQIRRAKELIFDAFTTAVDQGLAHVRPGVLVDEEFGATIARRASSLGHAVSMPVERALAPVFTFEYGSRYREHLLAFGPRSAKALVRYRTTDPPGTKRTQLTRLRDLSDFLAEQRIEFMLELIVGPMKVSATDVPTVDVEMLCASMAEVQRAGVQVDLWKVEGLSTQAAAARVAEQAWAGNARATCVVLGAGAPADVIGRWLDVAASTSGFDGFAIGRSIWGQPVAAWLDGDLTRAEAVERIASTYRSCTLRYKGVGVS